MNIPTAKPKLVGHCTVSDQPCYERISKYPQEHPLAGEPVSVQFMRDDSCRLVFELSDRTEMPLTFRKEIADQITDEDFPALWERVKTSWEAEMNDLRRQKLGMFVWSEERKQIYRLQFYDLSLEHIARMEQEIWRDQKTGEQIKLTDSMMDRIQRSGSKFAAPSGGDLVATMETISDG